MAGDSRIVGGGQNNTPIIAATVAELLRRNALIVAQVNASGDIVNPGGGSSNGDGAINDGINSAIKATVLNDATTSPSSSDKSLVVQFADGANREVGKVTVRAITSDIGITGDVSTMPKAGQVWPVQQSGAWAMTVTGDIKLESNSNRILGRIEGPLGVQVVGTSVGQFGISGDVKLESNYDRILGRIAGPLGVNVVGTTGRIGVSGDVSTTLADGVDTTIKGTIKDYANANPLTVVLVNVSGDVYNAAHVRQKTTAAYQRVNVTTTATLLLASNTSRLSAYVQNVERQQMYLGFDTALTVANAGIVLGPTVNNSGDGGNFSIDNYTGAIYGILASGDADARTVEL